MKTWLPDTKEIKEWPLGDEVYELVNWPIRHSSPSVTLKNLKTKTWKSFGGT